MKLKIEPEHLKIILKILEPIKNPISAFGSRTKNSSKKLSDLDLVIFDSISKKELNKIKESFDESNLPFKVDLIIWEEIDPNFQNHIKPDLLSKDNW